METITCECCELVQPNHVRQVAWENYIEPTICRECIEHRGKPQQRAEDHAREYRKRLDSARTYADERKADAERWKAEADRAFKSRDRALAALDAVSRHHQRKANGDRCICGKSDCPVLDALSNPWVSDRLTDRNLRNSDRAQSYYGGVSSPHHRRRRPHAG